MKNTRIISVANQKGGVGKTTSVVNIGAALAMKGYDVLLIDLDTQESLSNFFGIYSAENSIADLMCKTIKHEPIDLADYIVYNEKNKISIIPSELNRMNAIEKDLIPVRSRETVLKRTLSSLRGKYDYILLDCPASLNVILDNALTASDYVIIPCEAMPLSYAAVPNLLLQISDIQAEINPELAVLGIFPTKTDNTTNTAMTVQMLKDNYPDDMFAVDISRTSATANSALAEKAVVLSFSKKNKTAEQYRQLTDEIERRIKKGA